MPEQEAEEAKTVETVIENSWGRKAGAGTENGNKEEEKEEVTKRSGVVVSERDLELMEWVSEHRFSTKELLVERFYSEPTRVREGAKASGQYGAVRLRALVKQGYLKPSRYRILREAPLLVAELGYRLLHGLGRVPDYRTLPDIDIENFEHDVWVQRLRILFERDCGCQSWLTERAMKLAQQDRQLPYIPDGRFYGADGQAWNLEVERTPKRLERLREVIGIRAETSRKSNVLYVLDRRFSDFYREQMALSVNPTCFYVVHFDDLTQATCVGRPGVASPLIRLFGGKV